MSSPRPPEAADIPSTRLIGRRGTASVAAASIVSALAGYVILVVAARHLTSEENAEFLVYWSMLFALFGVLGGLQQESTRTVGATIVEPAVRSRSGARVLPWGLVAGATLAVLVAVTAPLWRQLFVGADVPLPVVVATVLGVVGYAGHVALVGATAGGRLWGTSSLLIGAESTVRVVLVLCVVVVGGGVAGLSVASAAATATWVVLLLVPAVRRACGARGDVPVRALLRGVLQACLAAAGFAVLVVGFPTLLRLTTDATAWQAAAPLVLAISMTRAPLMIPLGTFQGVAIGYFLDPRREAGAAMARLGVVVAGVGVIGAGAAWLVGPALMELFFGPGYRVDGGLLAGLTFASAVLATLVLSGSAALALARHGSYALAWVAATLAAVACLVMPWSIEVRALTALLVGPAVGVAVLVPALRRARPRARGAAA